MLLVRGRFCSALQLRTVLVLYASYCPVACAVEKVTQGSKSVLGGAVQATMCVFADHCVCHACSHARASIPISSTTLSSPARVRA